MQLQPGLTHQELAIACRHTQPIYTASMTLAALDSAEASAVYMLIAAFEANALSHNLLSCTIAIGFSSYA